MSGNISTSYAMSRTRYNSTCNVRESDSESSREPHRHPYNTRLSASRRRNRADYTDEVEASVASEAVQNRTGWFRILILALGVCSTVMFSSWVFYKIQEFQDKLQNVSSVCEGRPKHLKKHKHSPLLDPVSRADFALESSGGAVITTDAVTYDVDKRFFGLWVWEGSAHKPSALIRPWIAPGECWAFKGQKASAVIRLLGLVVVDGVTLEHIPENLSPTGTIDSAPRLFKLWGLADSTRKAARTLLGEFTYEANGTSRQTFDISDSSEAFKHVEFQVLSNHGNKDYTCVYRLQVHGKLKSLK